MSIAEINEWHKRARPEPTAEDFSVQLGCHFEEIAEMEALLTWGATDPDDWLALGSLQGALSRVSKGLKSGAITARVHGILDQRSEFLDSLCDQIVTATGVAHCANMDISMGLLEVGRSNWSKFVGGQPVFDANGKIAKGPNYASPDLEAYV